MNQTEWNVVIGILIPVGIAIATVWKQRRDLHKSLKYDYTATKIMEHTGGIAGSLVLTFSGQPVSNVSVVSISLRNAGRQPITQGDFDQGIRFEVEADRMLSVNSGQCKPSELPLTVRFNVVDKSIALDPLLLNAGDYIALSALVTGF